MLEAYKNERNIRLLVAAGAVLVLGPLAACGGTMAFADGSSLVVKGDAPPPPAPPPPPPPPPPPAPKRVEVTADKIVIHEKIQFDVNKSTIKAESHSLLDEIASVFKDNTQIKKVSIEGHTDSDGSEKYNQTLSDGRANAVMAYLTEHGVAAERLTAKGFGESKPMASNDTDEGKEQNRRVEFIITEQDEIKKVFEVDPKTGEKKEVNAPASKKDAKKAEKAEKKEAEAAEKADKKEAEAAEKAEKAEKKKAKAAEKAEKKKAKAAEKAEKKKAEKEAKATDDKKEEKGGAQ